MGAFTELWSGRFNHVHTTFEQITLAQSTTLQALEGRFNERLDRLDVSIRKLQTKSPKQTRKRSIDDANDDMGTDGDDESELDAYAGARDPDFVILQVPLRDIQEQRDS